MQYEAETKYLKGHSVMEFCSTAKESSEEKPEETTLIDFDQPTSACGDMKAFNAADLTWPLTSEVTQG
jgi:hypothetical protein